MQYRHQGKPRTGTLTPPGYRLITTDEGRILEHRFVMQNHLKRKLLPHEIVHHLNEDKLDNRIENLMLTTASDHKKEHPDIGKETRLKRIYEPEVFADKAIKAYKEIRNAKFAAKVVGCSEMSLHRLIKNKLHITSLKYV